MRGGKVGRKKRKNKRKIQMKARRSRGKKINCRIVSEKYENGYYPKGLKIIHTLKTQNKKVYIY